MNPFKNHLAGLEARLQRLFEEHLPRLVPNGRASSEFILALVNAMQAGCERAPDGELVAPNHYTIQVPESESAFLGDPWELEQLQAVLMQLGEEAGLRFISPPVISIEQVSSRTGSGILVNARVEHRDISETAGMEPGVVDAAPAAHLYAYLIVDGTRRFDLRSGVVKIGRSPENHLVINESHISRRHAELSYRWGHYVIIDLGSTGGIWVNGLRVSQQSLQDGDLISLAGTPLMYYQEGESLPDTQELMRSN